MAIILKLSVSPLTALSLLKEKIDKHEIDRSMMRMAILPIRLYNGKIKHGLPIILKKIN